MQDSLNKDLTGLDVLITEMRLNLWLKIPWRTFINYKPSEQLQNLVFDFIQQGNEKGIPKVGLQGHLGENGVFIVTSRPTLSTYRLYFNIDI